jgi:hypothetical protein
MADLSSIAVKEGASGLPQGGEPERRGEKRKAPERPDEAGSKRAKVLHAEREDRLKLEDELERRKLILKLRAWGSAFPKEVSDMIKDVESLPFDALKTLLQEIKLTVGTRTAGIVNKAFVTGGLLVAEGLIEKNTSLQVTGPVARLAGLSNDPNWQDLVKETTLEYSDWIYQHPLHRLMLYGMHQVMAIHAVNAKSGVKKKEDGGFFTPSDTAKNNDELMRDLKELDNLRQATGPHKILPRPDEAAPQDATATEAEQTQDNGAEEEGTP